MKKSIFRANFKYFLILMLFLAMAQENFAQYVPKEKRQKKTNTDSTTIQEPPQTIEERPNNTQDPRKQKKREGKTDLSQFSFGERLTYGGNFGFNFGNGGLLLDLSPTVGYIVTEKLVAGVGVSYIYNHVNFGGFKEDFHYYGGRTYLQYVFYNPIYLWAEIEGINGNYYSFTDNDYSRQWLISPLIGLGYRAALGGKAGFNFTVLYNLNHRSDIAFYGSPFIVRTGFNF